MSQRLPAEGGRGLGKAHLPNSLAPSRGPDEDGPVARAWAQEVATTERVDPFRIRRVIPAARAAPGPLRLVSRLARVAAALALSFSSALADGTFVWRSRAADIHEPEQKALLVFDDGVEDLVLEVKYSGAGEDFGWIVPLPSPPEMAPEQPELFEELSKLTQDPYYAREDIPHPRRRTEAGVLGGSSVRVLEQRRVGVYDATVLGAERGNALADWLAEHDFRLPRGGASVLDRYARRGWVFAALRVQPALVDSGLESRLAAGTIQPIRFRFRTPRPVYPLKISAMTGGKSLVLLYVLARQPLFHGRGPRVPWDEHYFGPFHGWGRRPAQPRYRGLDEGRGFLTKLRVLVKPGDMEDVYFRPYDAFTALRGSAMVARAEAASHLGWSKPPGADRALGDFLETATGEGPDVLAALWAVGEVNGPRAVRALESRARSARGPVRRAALMAFSHVATRRELGVFLEGLARPDEPQDSRVGLERRFCLDVLLAKGDSTCIPPLRGMLAQHTEERRWPPWEPNRSDLILAALVGAGELQARAALRDTLARETAVTRPGELLWVPGGHRLSDGSLTDFWTGEALLQGYESTEWPGLTRTLCLFEKAPAERDAIFRDLIRDSSVPDAARTVLVGHLERLAPPDRDTLLAIWSRALGPGRVMTRIEVTNFWDSHRRPGTVLFNLNACGVAHVFARQKDADALGRLWEEAPDDDPVLRAEIVCAMAVSGSPRFTGSIIDYVTTVWDAAARDTSLEDVLRTRPPRPRETWMTSSDWFDLTHRSEAIRTFLCRTARDTSILRRLISDRGLRPALRVFWTAQLPFDAGECAPLHPVAIEELAAIAESPASLPFEVRLARDVRRSLVRGHEAVARRAGE